MCLQQQQLKREKGREKKSSLSQLQKACRCSYSYPKGQMEMMRMTGVAAASSAAGQCDLHLCWQSCQELSSCIQTDLSAVHWHFITVTKITAALLFSLIVWQSCNIPTTQSARAPEPESHGYKENKTCQVWECSYAIRQVVFRYGVTWVIWFHCSGIMFRQLIEIKSILEAQFYSCTVKLYLVSY